MLGVKVNKIDEIIRMLYSDDFETQKLGFSLALEEFPPKFLNIVTSWKKIYLGFLNNYPIKYDNISFLTIKEIIEYALTYPESNIYFNRCIFMIHHIAVKKGITTI